MRSTFFTSSPKEEKQDSSLESPPNDTSKAKSISVRLRQWFPKPRRRLRKAPERATSAASPPANGDTTTTEEEIATTTTVAEKTRKRCPVSTPVLGTGSVYTAFPEASPKRRPHSMCVSLKALADDDNKNCIPETVPLSPITEEPPTAKPSPQLEDETTGFETSSRRGSVYIDHSCQTDDLPCLTSSCSCYGSSSNSQQPSRESTPSTPPLLTPTGPPPDSWKAWTEGSDLVPEHVTSSLEKMSKFRDVTGNRFDPEVDNIGQEGGQVFDSEDEDELAFYREQQQASSLQHQRPVSGLGAFLETMPSPEVDKGGSRMMSLPSSPPSSPLRREEFVSDATYSPERPRTRQRRDSLDEDEEQAKAPKTPGGVWAPHQLSAIPEDDEWDFQPIRSSLDSEGNCRSTSNPSTPRKTKPTTIFATAGTSPQSPRKSITSSPKRQGRTKQLDEYARAVQPTIIQSIAVYAGAFFRSQKLIDPDMATRPEEMRESLETVLLAGIEDIVSSVPRRDMVESLRRHFNPYVPEIAEAMVSGLERGM